MNLQQNLYAFFSPNDYYKIILNQYDPWASQRIERTGVEERTSPRAFFFHNLGALVEKFFKIGLTLSRFGMRTLISGTRIKSANDSFVPETVETTVRLAIVIIVIQSWAVHVFNSVSGDPFMAISTPNALTLAHNIGYTRLCCAVMPNEISSE